MSEELSSIELKLSRKNRILLITLQALRYWNLVKSTVGRTVDGEREARIKNHFCKEFSDFSGLDFKTSMGLLQLNTWKNCVICNEPLKRPFFWDKNFSFGNWSRGPLHRKCKKKLVPLVQEYWRCQDSAIKYGKIKCGRKILRIYDSYHNFNPLRYCPKHHYVQYWCTICSSKMKRIDDDINIPISIGYQLHKKHSYIKCPNCEYIGWGSPTEKWRELPLVSRKVKIIYEIDIKKPPKVRKIIKTCKCGWQTQENIKTCEKCGIEFF